MLVQGNALHDRLSGVRGAFVREGVAKKDLKFACGASAASAPITESAQRQVTEHLFTNGSRREIQRLANVQKRKRPGTIIGCDPAMSIEIEFPLDRARRAMEPSQIQRSLFEDSGSQIFPACVELVVVGSVHTILIWFVISSSSVRRSKFQKISEFLPESRHSAFLLAVIVFPAGLDLSGQIETEQ
jgi:hypothetical protein